MTSMFDNSMMRKQLTQTNDLLELFYYETNHPPDVKLSRQTVNATVTPFWANCLAASVYRQATQPTNKLHSMTFMLLLLFSHFKRSV